MGRARPSLPAAARKVVRYKSEKVRVDGSFPCLSRECFPNLWFGDYRAAPAPASRCGVAGLFAPLFGGAPNAYRCFFSAGFRIWNEHISVSSTLIIAPALSNSPQ